MVFPTDRTLFNRLAFYDIRRVDGFPGMGVLVPTRDTIRRESLLNVGTYLVPKHSTYHHSRKSSHARRLLQARLFKRPVERKPERPSGFVEQLSRIVVGTAAYFPDKLYRKLVVKRPYPSIVDRLGRLVRVARERSRIRGHRASAAPRTGP